MVNTIKGPGPVNELFLVRAGKYKLRARVGKYKLGARARKYKSGARAGKYKLGARAGKYKLVARTGGRNRGPGPEPGDKQRAGAGKHKDPFL